MQQGKYELALEQAVIAIDVSVQKYYNLIESSTENYKKFLREYFWVLELMGLNGIDVRESLFCNLTVMKRGKKIDKPDLFDVIYHTMRCCLVHSTGMPQNVTFNHDRYLLIAKEFISLPIGVVWGLLAIVVFAKINSGETSEGNVYFTYTQTGGILEQWQISTHWGKEEVLHKAYDQYVKIRVNLQIPTIC
jgi:hypothetical protein